MKRAIACVLMYAMVISVAAGGNRSAASVKGKLNKKKVTIAIGKNVQLKVKERGVPAYTGLPQRRKWRAYLLPAK